MVEKWSGGSAALRATGLPSLPGLLASLAGRRHRIFRRPQGRAETAALESVCSLCRRSTPRLTLSIPGVPARLPAGSAANEHDGGLARARKEKRWQSAGRFQKRC